MELVIQVLSRSGKVSHQHRINAKEINIGRAYDNQVIIEDIHVSEHHAQIKANELGEIEIIDLNSLNKVYDAKKKQIQRSKPINSGDEFYLGKLRIKILFASHPVPKTIKLTKSEETAELFTSTKWVVALSTLFFSLFAIGEYLSFLGEFEIKQLFTPLISLIFALLIWPVFWSLLSRFFKHDARFWAHFSTLLVTLLCLKGVTLLTQLISYNYSQQVAKTLIILSGFIIIMACFRFSLYLFNQKNDSRQLWLSFSLTCFIFSLASLGYYAKHKDFSPLPSYSGLILPSQLLWKEPITVDSFIDKSDSLFSQALVEAKSTSSETDEVLEENDDIEIE